MKKFLAGLFILVGLQVSGQSIEEYLILAAENNPALASKYKLYLAALEQVEQQGSLPDPTIGFGYFISPVETRVGAQNMKFSLSQMFPWMGTRAVRKQAASSWAKVRFEEFEEAKNTLFYQVQTKWLMLFELDQEIEIEERNLEVLKTYEPITKTKYESNLVSLADLIRAQIQIEEAQTELDLIKLKREITLGEFNQLLNRSATSPAETFEIQIQSNLEFSNMDSIFNNQPLLKAAQEKLQAMTYQMELAELKRKPNIGLGLDYAIVNERAGVTIPDNGKDILMPMINISVPIFGKKNQSAKKEAELQKESVSLSIDAIESKLKSDWHTAELTQTFANRELAQYDSEIEKTELLLRVLTSEYSNSNTSFEELLVTQQKLLKLQLAKVKAKVKLQQTHFRKQYLTNQY